MYRQLYYSDSGELISFELNYAEQEHTRDVSGNIIKATKYVRPEVRLANAVLAHAIREARRSNKFRNQEMTKASCCSSACNKCASDFLGMESRGKDRRFWLSIAGYHEDYWMKHIDVDNIKRPELNDDMFLSG